MAATLPPMATPPETATGLASAIGLEYLEDGPDPATGRVPVTDAVRQPYGIVHGGAYSTIAESIASRSTWLAVRDEGLLAFGQSTDATFLRPISEGTIHAVARPRHRGRTTWVWDCELTDDEDRLCALVRVTIAVRAQPS